MNPSNMQPLKAQSGMRKADEVGVLSAPRLGHNSSTKVLLSDSHKASYSPAKSSKYLSSAYVDKAIICCGECNHTRTHTHCTGREHMSCYLQVLRLVQGGHANISQ